MGWWWGLAALSLLAICCRGDGGSDSLRGALNAINRRQRNLADPKVYYLHPHLYTSHTDVSGDGQPENIGYGYQKSLAPKTTSVLEAIPLPESELGSRISGMESHLPEGKALDNLIIDYIEDNMQNSVGMEPPHNKNYNLKRSVFRERDIHELPNTLQNLYLNSDNPNQYYDNGDRPMVIPYRERPFSKSHINYPRQNTQSLVRNFGGLDRDTDNYSGSDDDPDEYLSVLNSVSEKYQDNNPDHFDPEDLSESDTESILRYINNKEKKPHYENSYENGYDFFNTPLIWVKRNKQRLTDKLSQHPYLHALKLLNGPTDTVESLQEEDMLDEDKDDGEAKLLLENEIPSRNDIRYKKRFWRGNTYDDHYMTVAKRYPITKRSYYTNPAVLYHQTSAENLSQRRMKNVNSHESDEITDPKVAMEISDIFSSPKNSTYKKEGQNTTDSPKLNQVIPDKLPKNNNHNHSKMSPESKTHNHMDTSHIKKKRSGQKEESGIGFQNKQMTKTKKSVDWSNYFGIDKRHKKSTNQPASDDWLLDQYLKAYSISAREFKDPSVNQEEHSVVEFNRKSSDDMDDKLRAMEDIIVDQALKYTGAHEGITNSEEVQTVKDRVIAQLAAAYSLEKMRKALSEFKSSIAAQQASPPTHTTSHIPTDVPEQKNKRVAVKKENVITTQDGKLENKEDMKNKINVFHPIGTFYSTSQDHDEQCPMLEEIDQQCKVISNIAGDRLEVLVPLCTWHQVCYLCGSELDESAGNCDTNFVSEANNLCGESGRCRYIVHRIMAAFRSASYSAPHSCDWQGHPCLARYLANTMR